eukprot:5068868-Pyramimonas_sp.AAC.1
MVDLSDAVLQPVGTHCGSLGFCDLPAMGVAESRGYRPSTDGTHCSLSGPRGSTAGISGGS